MGITNSTLAPFVTIGLPVYNGEKYLSLALDSLLAQTFTDFEIIISDNASTDNTEKICNDYAKKDKRIKYFRQDRNIGVVKNFLFVREEGARSKYFMWAAHDDLWAEDWLKVLLAEFKSDDLAVRGKVTNIDENGNTLGLTNVTSFNKGQVVKVFMDNEKNCRAFYWYALFNNQLLSQANLKYLDLDSTFGADVLLITHLVQFGALRTTEKTTQLYRRHTNSSTNLHAKHWFGLRKVIYYLFPINTYLFTIKIVNIKYKPLIFMAVPFKFIKSQFDIWPRIFKLLFTGSTL